MSRGGRRTTVAGLMCVVAAGLVAALARWIFDGPSRRIVDVPTGVQCQDALTRMCRSSDSIIPLAAKNGREPVTPAPDSDELEQKLRNEGDGRANSDVWLSPEDWSVVHIGGWVWDSTGVGFHRHCVAGNQRTYSVEGEFKRTSDGQWNAKLTQLRRVLTRAECSQLGYDATRANNAVIKIVPTTEEARDALLEWLKNKDYTAEVQSFPMRTEIIRDLERKETAASLASGRARPSHWGATWQEIDGWWLENHELQFQHVFYGPSSTLPYYLLGKFELSRTNHWRITSLSWRSEPVQSADRKRGTGS